MKMLPRIGAAAAALLLVSAYPGFGQVQEPVVWRHAIINPKADAGFYLMASRHGFDLKQGLKVDVLDVKDDQIGLRALLAGEVDSYEGSPTGAIVAAARGADIRILGCEWINLPHGIMVHDNIDNLKQLEGKSIAVSAPGTMPDMLARTALAHADVPVSDVTLAAVGGDRDRYSALVGGVVQAAVVSNEYLPLKSSKDLKMLVKGAQALPNLVRTCIVTTSKTVLNRHDELVRFLTAEIQALRYAVSHRDATIALTRQVIGAKPDDPRPAFVFDEAVKPGQVAPDLPLSMQKLAWMQDEMIKLHQMPHGIDLGKVVDKDIRAAALARAGQSTPAGQSSPGA